MQDLTQFPINDFNLELTDDVDNRAADAILKLLILPLQVFGYTASQNITMFRYQVDKRRMRLSDAVAQSSDDSLIKTFISMFKIAWQGLRLGIFVVIKSLELISSAILSAGFSLIGYGLNLPIFTLGVALMIVSGILGALVGGLVGTFNQRGAIEGVRSGANGAMTVASVLSALAAVAISRIGQTIPAFMINLLDICLDRIISGISNVTATIPALAGATAAAPLVYGAKKIFFCCRKQVTSPVQMLSASESKNDFSIQEDRSCQQRKIKMR